MALIGFFGGPGLVGVISIEFDVSHHKRKAKKPSHSRCLYLTMHCCLVSETNISYTSVWLLIEMRQAHAQAMPFQLSF